ncbi:MAG: hypothetical protein J6S29_01405 [Methanosphaera sp.]|nr:hypothetical protein [Methanosphaera sp.]
MDNKKLGLTIGVLIVILIAMFLVMNNAGNNQENITDIQGIKFNIPEGYVLNDNASKIGQLIWRSSDLPSGMVAIGDKIPNDANAYNWTRMVYENDTKNISIEVLADVNDSVTKTNDTVFEPGELKMTALAIFNHRPESNKTINGVDGELSSVGDYMKFSYFKSGSVIKIEAPDEETIKSIVVK